MSDAARIEIAENEDVAQLQQQIQQTEEEAAELALQIADLKLELRSFQSEYSARIGLLYVELDAVELEIREYQMRTELIRSGIGPDESILQQRVEEAFQAERERVSAAQEQISREETPPGRPDEETRRYRSIYLRLAKRYHPDKARTPEEQERNQRLMTLINQAYEEGDFATLERLVSEAPPESVDDESPADRKHRLTQQLMRLRQSVAQLKHELDRQQQRDVCVLKQQVEAARTRGDDLLEKLSRDIRYKIAAAQRRLNVVRNLFERWSLFLKGRNRGAV